MKILLKKKKLKNNMQNNWNINNILKKINIVLEVYT
jgi:hypothetical protein